MHTAQRDSNSDSTAGHRTVRNAATIAAGVIALAIAAAAVFDERSGRMPDGSGPAGSGSAPVSAISTPGRAVISNTPSATNAARPHFERSDEPVYTDTTNPYGG